MALASEHGSPKMWAGEARRLTRELNDTIARLSAMGADVNFDILDLSQISNTRLRRLEIHITTEL